MKSQKKQSRTLKLAVYSFWAAVIFIFLGIIEEITVGSAVLKFRMVSGDIILFLLLPCFGTYSFRRYTDYLSAKNIKKEE